MGGKLKWSVVLEVATAFVGIVTLVAAFVVIAGLPETVPVHFGEGGAPDRWGSKLEVLAGPLLGILIPALIIGISHSSVSGEQLHPWVREQKRAYAATAALCAAVVCAGGSWFSFHLVLSYL